MKAKFAIALLILGLSLAMACGVRTADDRTGNAGRSTEAITGTGTTNVSFLATPTPPESVGVAL